MKRRAYFYRLSNEFDKAEAYHMKAIDYKYDQKSI